MAGSLRPDLERTQIALDKLPDGSVVIDKHGHSWQNGMHGIYWYRAYDDYGPRSSWELCQSAPIHLMVPESKQLARPAPKSRTK